MEITCASRQPQESGPPVLGEVGAFVGISDFSLTERLNAPNELNFKMLPAKQNQAILTRFFDLAAQATEVWVWEEGEMLFAGPLLGYSPGLDGDDIAWTVRANGLLDYLKRMRVEPDGPDLVFTGVDQALIADGLIDYWQNLDYGHYGITTGVSSPHGVLRDRTYLAKESHLIAQRMSELAAVQNGFDFQIDPLTREFTAVYPGLGVDRTDTLFIDARSVVDPSAQISAGPEDLISDAYAVGENIVAHAVNTALRAAVGRAGFAASFNGVTEQATLDDHAAHILAERSSQLHDPAKTLFAIAFDWDDFGLGDLVSFDYDYGAGLMSEQRRVVARTMGLTREGAQTITVELK